LACPHQAKKIRDDLEKVKALISNRESVAVSLAPSWRGGTGYNRARIIANLKAMGVSIVSETALGAESVSMSTARMLNSADPGLYVSACCPVVVDYIRMYKPRFLEAIMPLASPAVTHARLLKDYYGKDLKVVFVGPCVAKKGEADLHPDLIHASLTFGELKRWFLESQFDEVLHPIDEEATFSPVRSFEGALYALSGGMIDGLVKIGLKDTVRCVHVNTLSLLGRALDDLANADFQYPVFVEALACSGGCVNGPAISGNRSAIMAMTDLLRHVKTRETVEPGPFYTHLAVDIRPSNLTAKAHPFDKIQEILAQLGKHLPEDEINCAGCGYNSCRELAAAICDGQAEPTMCVSSMRKLATRKAAALVKAMPSAIVMVDHQMNILEVNEAFVRMFTLNDPDSPNGPANGYDRPNGYERPNKPGSPGGPPNCQSRLEDLIGTPVTQWVEFGRLIRKVLMTGQDIHIEHRLYKGKLFNVYIFSVEKYQVAGAIVTDMTALREGRFDLAKKVREVINKNIATAQEIACLLGEHVVETETLLSAVAADYEEGTGSDGWEDDNPRAESSGSD
jgi:PAS domain-containing protein